MKLSELILIGCKMRPIQSRCYLLGPDEASCLGAALVSAGFNFGVESFGLDNMKEIFNKHLPMLNEEVEVLEKVGKEEKLVKKTMFDYVSLLEDKKLANGERPTREQVAEELSQKGY